MPVSIIDSYSESNKDNNSSLNGGGGFLKIGQSFTGNGLTLGSVQLFLADSGIGAGGSCVVKIYAETHTVGFGTDSIPTGAALATSSAVSVAGLTATYQLISFPFPNDQQITLVDGTNYVLSIEPGDGNGNNVGVGYDGSSTSHAGNYFDDQGISTLLGVATRDLCFYVNSKIYDESSKSMYLIQGFQ